MIFENMICLSYLGCSSSFTFEFIIHEQCDMHSVSLYMPQGRAHRYTLDNATGTGEHRSNPNEKPGSTHVQYTQNHDTSTRSNPSFVEYALCNIK